jgi:hypothetical protein
VDPVVIAVGVAIALVAIGFVAWQVAVGAGIVAAYRERAADTSPPLAVFLVPAAARPRLLVRNRGGLAALRVIAWERRGLSHDPVPLASVERIEPGAAAEIELDDRPTAPTCHLEWTPDLAGAVRRQADVPFLELDVPAPDREAAAPDRDVPAPDREAAAPDREAPRA